MSVRAGVPSFTRKVLSLNFKEREDAESVEINFHLCLRHINMGISNLSFTDTAWTKEKKTIS